MNCPKCSGQTKQEWIGGGRYLRKECLRCWHWWIAKTTESDGEKDEEDHLPSCPTQYDEAWVSCEGECLKRRLAKIKEAKREKA